MCTAMLVWPIAIVVLVFMWLISDYIEDTEKRDRQMAEKYQFCHDDRIKDIVVEANEKELKRVLKLIRKEKIELGKNVIEAIREELLSRNMEKNLLK